MRTEEIMRWPVPTCRATDSLNAVAQVMWEQNCDAIPIVDEGGRLVGIVTDRDVCMAAYTQGAALAVIPVQSAMVKQVVSVHPEDSIDEAERLMTEKHVRRIPVVNADGKPVGILSEQDVADQANHGRRRGTVSRVLHNVATVLQSRLRRLRAA